LKVFRVFSAPELLEIERYNNAGAGLGLGIRYGIPTHLRLDDGKEEEGERGEMMMMKVLV
jgi:hypothetical protein